MKIGVCPHAVHKPMAHFPPVVRRLAGWDRATFDDIIAADATKRR